MTDAAGGLARYLFSQHLPLMSPSPTSYPVPHVVHILGAPCSGKTTLVRALGGMLEDYDVFPANDAGGLMRRHAVERKFKTEMAAQRCVAEGRGAVVDGCIDDEMALVELDLHHGRVGQREATALFKFGRVLKKYLAAPTIAIHLDTTPEVCLGRAPEASGLALADHARLDENVRDAVAAFEAKGTEVFRRNWAATYSKAKVNCVRDTVLCALPEVHAQRVAPPSEAAVARILRDARAGVQPPPRRVIDAETAGAASPRTPSGGQRAATAVAHASPASCTSCQTTSPHSILTRFEDLLNAKQSLFADIED